MTIRILLLRYVQVLVVTKQLFLLPTFTDYTKVLLSAIIGNIKYGIRPIGIGGYKELIMSINGDGAYGMLKFESGVHRGKEFQKLRPVEEFTRQLQR